ncbi:transcriptional repressor LexA [Swaminathania salitolerans]|uniref:LexA repressor n=1 Tax=Swaminathania salitolerans TaxID=182838 RepID=A0A511BNY5_9PROT|nr:transcriptional repressor LexA [Swaminathania salitolerans]GBQ15293.1 LexA repressor [Swaminathania salitolerans LMG 21291]GEL02056.1 LexA repressor [Swaminathania salitolerans]
MLTRKQHQLLVFIDGYLRRTGFSPSFDEMKEALDLRSKSGIHRLISALEERGFLRRHHHRARALEILRLPVTESTPQAAPAGAPANTHTAETGTFPRLAHSHDPARPSPLDEARSPVIGVPLFGRIAAGLPIEAFRDQGEQIEIPAGQLGSGQHYALHVSGESMIEAGILDGDTVIIRQTETAENGQIVVALVDGQEVTLKRLRQKGKSIALEPANAHFETQIFPQNRVSIQGVLIGLYRRYD